MVPGGGAVFPLLCCPGPGGTRFLTCPEHIYLAEQVVFVLGVEGEMVDGAEHTPSETAVVVAPVLHDQRLHPAAAGQVLLACIRAIAQF